MFLLLFLKSFNPHIPGLLFTSNSFIEALDFILKLLFGQVKLPLDALRFHFNGLDISFKIYNFLVHILDFVLLA